MSEQCPDFDFLDSKRDCAFRQENPIMTGRGPYDPSRRGETPEERVDRLISEILTSPNASNCAELRAALALLPNRDEAMHARASVALNRCR